MSKKIKDLTDKELEKLCMVYKPPCPDNCRFKLDNKAHFILSCKLTNPKYRNDEIEVEDNE